MQPYLFPYLGYFQLICAVDKFVLFDDAQWIRGWINRHNILFQDKEKLVTLAVQNHPSRCSINEVIIDSSARENYLQLIESAYKKAPFFSDIFAIVENILGYEENNLSKFILNSLQRLSYTLEIDTEFLRSSTIEYDRGSNASNKLIEITKSLGAKTYVNTIRGEKLYNKEDFLTNNLELKFLNRTIKPYKQFKADFVPYLSIIDVLMFNGIEKTKQLVMEFDLK
jgi:hypothetical protein